MNNKPMKKLYRYVKFRLKMTYKNIVRRFGLTSSVPVVVPTTLILTSVLMLLTNNLNNLMEHIEQQITIRAGIGTIMEDKQKRWLSRTIKQLNTAEHVTLSIGKEELENYKVEFQDSSAISDIYEGRANPICDTFLIEVKNGKDIQRTTDKTESMKGIVSAECGGGSTDGMISTFEKIREGGMISIIFLIMIAVLLIFNKAKMPIYTRRQEIAIMRSVRTNGWVIRFPMILGGAFIGALGSLVPVLLTILGYRYVYTILDGTFMSNMFVLQTIFPIILEISRILVLIGVFVGLMGGFSSTTRYPYQKC